MDLFLTKQQQEIRERHKDFAAGLDADLASRDTSGKIDETRYRADWLQIANFGVLGLAAARAFGGQGHDIPTAAAALYGLGQGCRDNGLLLAINAQIWTVIQTISEFGSEAQKQALLPRLVAGEIIGSDAVSEAAAGSDAMTVQTTAEPSEGGYLFNGEKVYVGQAPFCDIAITFAQTDPKAGAWGVSAFIVPMDLPGIERGSALDKIGYRTIANGTIRFSNVRLPATAMLGKPGAGKAIFGRASEWERQMIFASHVGAMERQLSDAIAFARARKSQGQRLSAYQSVSNRLADMQVRLETCRLLQMRAAFQMENQTGTALDASVTKLTRALVCHSIFSKALLASSLDAQRIEGGAGLLFGSDAGRDTRDHLGSVVLGGTSDIQRNIIAALQRP